MTFLLSMPCVALVYSSPGDGDEIHALCAVRYSHPADYMLAELMQESVELLDGLLFFHYD